MRVSAPWQQTASFPNRPGETGHKKHEAMKEFLRCAAVVAVCLVAFSAGSLAGNNNSAQLSQLPTTAQKFVKKHFSSKTVTRVTRGQGKSVMPGGNHDYEVIFSNGWKLKFDRNGDWTEVDCRNSSVPSGIVPKEISNYVKKNHKGADVTKITLDRNRYGVELSNRLRVDFDKKTFAVVKLK